LINRSSNTISENQSTQEAEKEKVPRNFNARDGYHNDNLTLHRQLPDWRRNMKFTYQNPTQLIFGAGTLTQLGEVVRKYGNKALLVTGGGSVKRNGTFERAIASLNAAGVAVAECSGVEPNPRLSTVVRGADIARSEGCDVVVALGGGSTMDAAKVMAAAVFYEGDPWNMMVHVQDNCRLPERALPVITVPTLAATGSEMNGGSVITDEKTTVKSFVTAKCLYPRAAIVDPELTVSVPKDQTAFGICDLITHVTESYFNGVDGTPLQDRFAEGVILTAMEWGPRAVADGHDLEARAQVQWASVVALNGWVQVGTGSPFPVHMIEHSLSAHHDIPHGAGLAVVNPAWMRFAARSRPARFAQFAERIFGLSLKHPKDAEAATEGIDRLEAFLRSIGCPTRLSELGIGEAMLDRYAKDTMLVAHNDQGRLPGRPTMSEADIIEVLRSVL
jgi:alcohol dehydrogenase YqhD (iron-dependent ADH family)